MVLLAFLLPGGSLAQEKDLFTRYFEDLTMRLDFYQSGNAFEEHVSLDRIVSDGAWAGSRTGLATSVIPCIAENTKLVPPASSVRTIRLSLI
jgi:hypothetical protein